MGIEELLVESVLLGGHGCICGGANMFPQLYVKAYQAAVANNIETARHLHKIIILIRQHIYSIGQYGSRILKGIKCVLSCMDICDDFLAEPFHKFRPEQRNKIRKILDETILPEIENCSE